MIEEGMLERYLLGELKSAEVHEVEAALASDPETRALFAQLEASLEQIAMENAVIPPVEIKEKLKEKIDLQATRGVHKIEQKSGYQPGRLLVAASLAALFALSSYWFYSQWREADTRLEDLTEETSALREQLFQLENQYEATAFRYQTISAPGSIPLLLVGNEKAPVSSAIAYVNHQERTVVVNATGLQPLTEGRTYQMWADVKGEMINMGLLPYEEDYIPVRYIDKAESLNITIEPEGGSLHPTVENLISNIYL